MHSMRHLLAATDFSEYSLYAVKRGFMIAKSNQAKYTVMHALGMGAIAPFREFLGEGGEKLAQDVTEGARSLLVELVNDPANNMGIKAEVQLEDGLPSTVIPTYAESANIDMILLGARGSSLLERMLIGSTANGLLHLSKCPILIVKQSPREEYKRILVATDFSPGSEKIIRMARCVAPEADILLLHVFEVPFEGKMLYAGVSDEIIYRYQNEARERSLRQLNELAEKAGLSREDYTAMVLYGDADAEIVAQQSEHNCDLVVMGKHGTNTTEELLLGSVTNQVLADSPSDVLVVVDGRIPL